MFSIGEFSRISGLTVKTLRFYHEQGILYPSCIDEQSGYRYYDKTKVDQARVISYLRGLDFSLAEIGELLGRGGEDADLLDVMRRQKVAIQEKIRRYRRVVKSLDQFITEEKEERTLMTTQTFQIEEKTLPGQLIAGVRMKGKYAECGKGFGRIGRRFGRHICGKAFLLHYDDEFREDDADFEACMPVRKGASSEGIDVRELPGGRCITLLHQGPYEHIGRSYARILDYIKEKELHVVLPTREVYLKGPGMIFKGNPKKYLTEIQMLVQ